MHRFDHLRMLVQQGEAEAFARELNLDPRLTRQWFDHGFPQEDYGTEVIKVLGAHMLKALTAKGKRGEVHG